MTYCLGIRVKDGLVCLADRRITSGTQVSISGKISLHRAGNTKVCIMTSGLRSLRDKTLSYFDDLCANEGPHKKTRLRDLIDYYTQSLRRVNAEDREALMQTGLNFDLHTLIGGQLKDDKGPGMYLVYPEGNWIEMDKHKFYLSIGSTSYGKAFLDRTLHYDTNLSTVLKIAWLSFDSTRVSSADVGFPIDLMTFTYNKFPIDLISCTQDKCWRQASFKYDDLANLHHWWNKNVRKLISTLPADQHFKTLLPEYTALQKHANDKSAE